MGGNPKFYVASNDVGETSFTASLGEKFLGFRTWPHCKLYRGDGLSQETDHLFRSALVFFDTLTY